MPVATQQQLDVVQLSQITRTCRRWTAVESLPAPVRRQLEALDGLSERVQLLTSMQEDYSVLLALLKKRCQSLRAEFDKINVKFVCPACPLRVP